MTRTLFLLALTLSSLTGPASAGEWLSADPAQEPFSARVTPHRVRDLAPHPSLIHS